MIAPGQDILWSIKIENFDHPDGSAAAMNVGVTHKIPDKFHIVRVVTVPNDIFTCADPGAPSTVGAEITCTSPSVGVGHTATITMHATANSDASGGHENRATMTTPSMDGISHEASARGLFVGWKSDLQVEAEALEPAVVATDVACCRTPCNVWARQARYPGGFADVWWGRGMQYAPQLR